MGSIKRLNPGKLRKQIVIGTLVENDDGTGGAVEVFTPIATRYASIEPFNGREFFDGKQHSANLSIRFRLRYDAALKDLPNTAQVTYDSRTFDIEFVINKDEADRELLLMCSESL